MAGSSPFSIKESDKFNRSFKKLAKIHGSNFIELVAKVLEDLTEDQYPPNSRNEPLPAKIRLPEGWTFHKLALRISQGASGQIRLMYLVDTIGCVIIPAWIYSHEEFVKRPADKDLKSIINEIINY